MYSDCDTNVGLSSIMVMLRYLRCLAGRLYRPGFMRGTGDGYWPGFLVNLF